MEILASGFVFLPQVFDHRLTRSRRSPDLPITHLPNRKIYFAPVDFILALNLDLYLDPVFLWITPCRTALSMIETVDPNDAFAWAPSPDPKAARNLRRAVRKRDLLERLAAVRFSV